MCCQPYAQSLLDGMAGYFINIKDILDPRNPRLVSLVVYNQTAFFLQLDDRTGKKGLFPVLSSKKKKRSGYTRLEVSSYIYS